MQKFVLNKERNVTLTALLQPIYEEVGYIKNRPAILILPGGGYQFCSDREAEPVAYPYLQAGFHAFVLRYSVLPHEKWPNPLNDYEQAMEFIKAHAEEWHLLADKIAVIGFSAGGHLAGMAATVARNKPAAAILGYPCTTEENCKKVFPDLPSPVTNIDENTCPCFLWHTRDDMVADIDNSIDFIKALSQHSIAFESHIYSYGPHGLSTCDSSLQLDDGSFTPKAQNWVSDSVMWLKEVLGDFGQNGLTEPKCPSKVNGDSEKYLSVNCTIGLIHSVKEADDIVSEVFNRALEFYKKTENMENEHGIKSMGPFMFVLFSNYIFKIFAEYFGASEEQMQAYDKALKKIKNPRYNNHS